MDLSVVSIRGVLAGERERRSPGGGNGERVVRLGGRRAMHGMVEEDGACGMTGRRTGWHGIGTNMRE